MKINYRKPTVNEYKELRQLSGWPSLEDHLIEEGLKNSIFSVVVLDENDLILGMGRIIGDNAIYLHIQDVIVRPANQREGIGRLLMNELLKYVDKVAGKNTNIGLMCSKGREGFYKEFGFEERPNDRFGAGMIMIK